MKYTTHYLGCLIDGSHDSVDSFNADIISFAEDYGFDAGEMPKEENDDGTENEDYGQILNEIADDAVSFLNDCDELPPYCSYTVDESCLFLSPSVEQAEENVEFKSSKEEEYPDDDFRGEWLHVNDHGNCTLYVRQDDGKDVEIWSLV